MQLIGNAPVPKPTITTPRPFQKNPSGFYGIRINREFSIQGFDLDSPRSIQGLNYSWVLRMHDNKYSLQVIRKNSREVVLKIMATGEIPDYYFDRNQHQDHLEMLATCNGEQKQLDWFKIYLKR